MLVRWLFPWLQNSLSGGPFPASERQVALFFPGVRTALSGGSMKRPWLQEMHPTAKWCNKHVNQQVLASFQRPPKMSLPSVFWLSLDFGQGMHPYPRDEEQSARELLDLHFHRGPIFQCSRIAHSETCEKKAKTKARGQSRGESPKGNHQFPKLGDHQERRHTHKWRKTD